MDNQDDSASHDSELGLSPCYAMAASAVPVAFASMSVVFFLSYWGPLDIPISPSWKDEAQFTTVIVSPFIAGFIVSLLCSGKSRGFCIGAGTGVVVAILMAVGFASWNTVDQLLRPGPYSQDSMIGMGWALAFSILPIVMLMFLFIGGLGSLLALHIVERLAKE